MLNLSEEVARIFFFFLNADLFVEATVTKAFVVIGFPSHLIQSVKP